MSPARIFPASPGTSKRSRHTANGNATAPTRQSGYAAAASPCAPTSSMNESGVKPELECFDSGHTQGVAPLLDMGVLKPPLQFSFIVNVLGGIPGHVESLQLQTRIMPPGSEWEVIGISHGQWRMLAAALVMGGNIRCGLEDHLYLPSGEMAKSNGDMIETLVRLVRDVGRRLSAEPRAAGDAAARARFAGAVESVLCDAVTAGLQAVVLDDVVSWIEVRL